MIKKRRKVRFALIAALSAACATSNIDTVKGGVISDYPTVQIGTALEASPICTGAKNWSEFTTDQGLDLVEFRCKVSAPEQSLESGVLQLYRNSTCPFDAVCADKFDVAVQRFVKEGATLVVQFAMSKEKSNEFFQHSAEIEDPEGESCLIMEKHRELILPHLLGVEDNLNEGAVMEMCLGSLNKDRKVMRGS